ncbi:MAG: ABC transporter permease [Bacteroidales bacterium]
MIINYLKISFRNIKKHKLHSFINIFGLAVGLSAVFLIFSFVFHEINYDKFNKDAEHIYRLTAEISRPNGQGSVLVINQADVGPRVKEEFPQVEEMLRIKGGGSEKIAYRDELYQNFMSFYADSTFFSMFDYELLKGNPNTVLDDPGGVVINEKVARAVFKSEDPVGKMISISDREFRITGVMKDFPAQSHIQTDVIMPLKSHPYFERLGGMEFFTYIKIAPEHDNQEVRDQICQTADDVFAKVFEGSGYSGKNRLQPLLDIHLKSTEFQYDFSTNGDIQQVYFYSFLAFIILLVGVINYLNLFTANAEYRKKEVGLRKVVGARRKDLMMQFLSESVLTTLFAFVIAVTIVELTIGKFGDLMGSELSSQLYTEPQYLGIVLFVVILVGIAAGYYPAIHLSRFNVLRIFRGGQKSVNQHNKLTVFLVIVQFIIAIFMISAVIIFNQQIEYMKNKDMGFDKSQVLVVSGISSSLRGNYDVVREKLESSPQIEYVTSSQAVPGMAQRSGQTIFEYGQPKSSGISIKENRINYDYIETFGMEIKEGRSFSREYSDEANRFIINERAQRELGLEDPIGKKVSMGFRDGEIIGVVKDYNYASLKHEITPVLLTIYHEEFNKNYYSLKLNPGDHASTIEFVEKVLTDVDPGYTMNYFFLDDFINRLYKSEERSRKLVSFGTILSLILAFLGLFALTSFSIVKRTKEIGIRKVMGATQSRIVKLLTSDMLKWIALASVLALPLAYYVMNNWLQDFAYRIDIQFWMLIVSALLAIVVALTTTSVLTIKAANTNPAETLRDE